MRLMKNIFFFETVELSTILPQISLSLSNIPITIGFMSNIKNFSKH